MKIVTWNCNSVRARLERVLQWMSTHNPDILCLQELKCTREDFPEQAFVDLGYQFAVHGQKTYNGVAIVSKQPLTDVVLGIPDGVEDPQARVVTATIETVRVVNVYAPNGQTLDSPAYQYKLKWFERLHDFVFNQLPVHPHTVVLGDFNIAPEDIDVYDPPLWTGQVLCSPSERAAWKKLESTGLVDAFRHKHPGEQKFSWWDYRSLAFPKNQGLRIDHLLVSKALMEKCSEVAIDREARKGKQPSDHAPVWANFKLG